MAEPSRHLTIMIMPETSADEVRRIRIARRSIALAIGAVVAVVTAAVGSLAYAAWLVDEAREVESLRAENTVLRARIVGFDERLEGLTGVVDGVRHFETKLRALTMISDPERNLAMGPVGEPAIEGAPAPEADRLRRDLISDPNDATIQVAQRLEWVERAAQDLEGSARGLSVLLEGQQQKLSATPSRKPNRGYMTSGYGMRIDPFTGLANLHTGIDFSAPSGAPVTATADGVVILAGKQGGLGTMVEIDHGSGLVTGYAHLQATHVKVGEKVKRGHLIGEVGNTGRSTGPHLHYEIRINGIPQDPRRFILED
jgi:murein DD-endopeptidase MepM/ murein hydrolase activator NlpD